MKIENKVISTCVFFKIKHNDGCLPGQVPGLTQKEWDIYCILPKIRPCVVNLSGSSKRGVGIYMPTSHTIGLDVLVL